MRKRGFAMYSTKEISVYNDYKPVVKKHQNIDVQAYISAKISKELYANLEACIKDLANSIVWDLFRE